MLKSHDVAVCLQLLVAGSRPAPTYVVLSTMLGMSASEVHASVKRAFNAGLLHRAPTVGASMMPLPVRAALSEFLIHGVKYVWPASRGALTRGVPTCSSVAGVAALLNVAEPEVPQVWPDPQGEIRGETIEPLFSKATIVARRDPAMHEWLALLDILRVKSGREASLAVEAIQRKLS